ncbi:Bacteriochlorophyllide c C-7(1)-hydroxylase, partial [Bienertia sinuspersici]
MKKSKNMFLKKENRVTMEDDTDTEAYYDQEGPIGQGVGLEDACPHDLNSEPVNEREVMNIKEEGELNISIQVKGWDEYTSETLDHLWACIKEKCSFDDPEYRRESVMKHAQRLKTKEERLKNKPSEMTKIEWKFSVDHWSDEKFKEKNKKASESRAHQKMPHYNGTKSFTRLRQEICSRVDVLVASRTRKSKKVVNALTLEKNTLAVDEIKKLKEQRDQGLNDKTDEQIFQDVLGKDTNGYLKAYGAGKSITQHFKELIEVKKKADQLIEEARKDVENARMEAEQAKKEAEAVRNDVERKTEQNNTIWEKKFHQLMNFIKGVLTQTMMIQEMKAHHDE